MTALRELPSLAPAPRTADDTSGSLFPRPLPPLPPLVPAPAQPLGERLPEQTRPDDERFDDEPAEDLGTPVLDVEVLDADVPDVQVLPADVPDAAPAQPRPRRALPRHPLAHRPHRRFGVLLVAAVLGAVVAITLGLGRTGAPTGTDLTAALGSDASFSGGVDAEARGQISSADAKARLEDIAATRAAREPDYALPTKGYLSTCYCMRWGTMHWGIDLAAPLGTPIYAATDGVVLRAGPATGYGNAIYVQDADGNVEIYGHMRYYYVQAGDVVSAGDKIALVGAEGQATGPHLHFEIHLGGMNGSPTDPQKWLADRGVTIG